LDGSYHDTAPGVILMNLRRIKRAIYQLPIMAPYRDYRSDRLSQRFRDHPLGFRFAGRDGYFRDTWEPHERAAIAECLKDTDVFIDVGANEGIYTCLAARAGVHVCAIEPEAGNLKFLMSNIHANDYEGVEVFPVAVAETAAVRRFYGDGVIASLVPQWHSWRPSFSRLTPITSLDNLFACRWVEKRLFIKIDVEGAEMDVIRGAQLLLSRDIKPRWLVETFAVQRDTARSANRDFEELFATMFRNGYNCKRIDTGEVVTSADVANWAASPADADIGRANFLFD
jgi:FkbM family methyltransferase